MATSPSEPQMVRAYVGCPGRLDEDTEALGLHVIGIDPGPDVEDAGLYEADHEGWPRAPICPHCNCKL